MAVLEDMKSDSVASAEQILESVLKESLVDLKTHAEKQQQMQEQMDKKISHVAWMSQRDSRASAEHVKAAEEKEQIWESWVKQSLADLKTNTKKQQEQQEQKISQIDRQVAWMLRRFIYFGLTDTWPANAAFSRWQRVEIRCHGTWYLATVTAAHDNGTFDVIFDAEGWWGTGERQVRSNNLRDLPE